MTHEQLSALCLSFPGASLEHPFGSENDVYKVNRKMFALVVVDSDPPRMNLKCDPVLAESLRREHPGRIIPGYHMNKRHWNTITAGGDLPDQLVMEMVEDSFDLVAPKRGRVART